MSIETPRTFLNPHREGGELFNSTNLASQNLRFFPSLSEGLVQRFHDSISPDPTNVWAARLTKGLVLDAMTHVVYSRMISNMLPLLRDNQSLVSSTGIALNNNFFDVGCEVVERMLHFDERTPEEKRFILSGMSWLIGAAAGVFSEIDSDPKHPYRPLLEQLEKSYTNFHDSIELRDGRIRTRHPDYEPKRSHKHANARDAYIEGTTENIHAAALLLEKREQARYKRVPKTSSEDLGEVVRSDLLHLGDAASVHAPRFKTLMASDETLVEEGPMDKPICVFTHDSLQNGPQYPRRICTGQFILRSPFLRERREADEFFEDAGITIDNGAFDVVSALLVTGERIAEETIWREDSSALV